ncbi:uncharacterized protein MAM_00779 [Metarhizium album ARSEF 1941]|uniref:AB hydrolase-1 domain-containing protein n=1 Tax=Metarhizium album (strain ARSEF 1941) TaxID=1081103 RepID=A0A0B2X7R7_METAS|nr:uncharacterized protein MAM_00779 [Metarhizium album ARSEF 1941]KHO01778.1 hypothetical protein MAM_00779 [Metarhizium album ARSEF 1941]
MAALFNVTDHIIHASHIREFARATAISQDTALELHVKQYTPKDNASPHKGDVTFIGAHANGFPKEVYEPFYSDLYRELRTCGVNIRDIWIADCAWQGQSGILNQQRGLLGNDPSWYDYSRDIAHIINTFRMPRPLVALGHSFGATALSYAALAHPRLFHSMVLLDPVIAPYHKGPMEFGASPATASVNRRDLWPSREAAATQFKKSPFYRAWDPRVLELWIKHGLHSTTSNPDGEVVLATTKHQEVFTFLRPSWPAFDAEGKNAINPKWMPDCGTSIKLEYSMYPFYRPEPINTFMRMPSLRPGVVFILGGRSTVISNDAAEKRTEITGTGLGGSGGVASGRVKQVVHEKYGHLIPLEVPGFCARHAAEFVKQELDIWAAEEAEFEEWAKKSNTEKVTVSQEYKKHLGVGERPRAKM